MYSTLFSPFGAAMVQTQSWLYENITPEYLQWVYHGKQVAILTIGQLFS